MNGGRGKTEGTPGTCVLRIKQVCSAAAAAASARASLIVSRGRRLDNLIKISCL